MGSRNHTTTPQIPSPHLLTRTLASPAWVSQTPIGLPAGCAMAAVAQSNAAKTEIIKPGLATMEKSPRQGSLHNKKTNTRNVSRITCPSA
jgi:hypothetical protein